MANVIEKVKVGKRTYFTGDTQKNLFIVLSKFPPSFVLMKELE